MIGQTLSHYKIVEKLGQGGMGVVYKAQDTRLDRFVAIKILPAGHVSDLDRRRRFVQEAKAASALNHPNIVTVHDFDSDGDIHFIVMEYVAGKTLDRRIGSKGIKLSEALDYAVQIADALAKAHSAGIVHRDLKPANIMVTENGTVKVLDFGLAKLTERAETEETDATISADSRPHTEEGTIVGTVAYMSPEQAEGKKIDARSDIFSFGSVLYEMLTGKRPFQGETKAATMASILREEPKPPKQITADLPEEVERVVMRALRKDPQRRWQHMDDLMTVLRDLKEDSDSGKLAAGTGTPPAAKARIGRLLPVVVPLLVLLAIVAWWLFHESSGPSQPQITRVTYDSGLTFTPAISPDGKLIAYSSDRGGKGDLNIYVQQLNAREPIQRTTHEADDRHPCFSPDGLRIVFRSERDGGGIYLMDALSGEENRIADRGLEPRFSPDGKWIAYWEAAGTLDVSQNKMYLLAAEGGAPKIFQPDFGVDVAPVWSPDSRQLLFSGRKAKDPKSSDWWLALVDGGPAIRTGARAMLITPSAPLLMPLAWFHDQILFMRGAVVDGVNLFSAAISPETGKLADQGRQLTWVPGVTWGVTVAADGRMYFPIVKAEADIWETTLAANAGTTNGDSQPVTQDGLIKGLLSATRDGSKLAYFANVTFQNAQRVEIRLLDIASGHQSVIATKGAPINYWPRLSRDGSVLSYSDQIDGKLYTFLARSDAIPGRQGCENCLVFDFFSNPNEMLARSGSGTLVRMNASTEARIEVFKTTSGAIQYASLSANDRWIAVLLGKPTGTAAIYLIPIQGKPVPEREWIPVAEDIRYLGAPRWSPDGNLLYYLSDRDGHCCIWAQRLDSVTRKPVGEPFGVWHEHRVRYSITLWPRSVRDLGITHDKLFFFQGNITSNIYSSVIRFPEP